MRLKTKELILKKSKTINWLQFLINFNTKLLLLAATVIILQGLAPSTFAQSEPNESYSTTHLSGKQESFKKSGMYLGLDYVNFTDSTLKYKISSKNKYNGSTFDKEDSSYDHTHVGFYGLKFGYNHIAYTGFGFQAGAIIIKSLNKSETDKENFTILAPQMNLIYLFTPQFIGYAGLNVSYFADKPKGWDSFKPYLGTQFGFNYRINQAMRLDVGYLLISQTAKEDEDKQFYTGTNEYTLYLGGFNSALVYTF